MKKITLEPIVITSNRRRGKIKNKQLIVRELLTLIEPYNQQKLARDLGWDHLTFGDWRSGRKNPQLAKVTQLAHALGYDVKLVERP